MSHIFISHSSADASVVEEIVTILESQGANCWIASRDIPYGEIYQAAIVEAINESIGVGVVISANIEGSDHIVREMQLAETYQKKIIPINTDNHTPSGAIAYYVLIPQRVDYFRDKEEALTQLAKQLELDLRKSDAASMLIQQATDNARAEIPDSVTELVNQLARIFVDIGLTPEEAKRKAMGEKGIIAYLVGGGGAGAIALGQTFDRLPWIRTDLDAEPIVRALDGWASAVLANCDGSSGVQAGYLGPGTTNPSSSWEVVLSDKSEPDKGRPFVVRHLFKPSLIEFPGPWAHSKGVLLVEYTD